jgi:hypothetical protein
MPHGEIPRVGRIPKEDRPAVFMLKPAEKRTRIMFDGGGIECDTSGEDGPPEDTVLNQKLGESAAGETKDVRNGDIGQADRQQLKAVEPRQTGDT